MKPCIGFIVPTMNRTASLNRLLQSIYAQSERPSTVIIVDGSDEPVEPYLVRDRQVDLIYVREHPPSLTRQRNAGIRSIPAHLTHIGFLDDDLVLLPGCLEAISSFIASHDETLAGAGFNIKGDPPSKLRFLSVLAGHSSFTPGKVRSSGYATSNVGAKTTYYSEWLCGGATIWRKSVLQNFGFDEWFQGYALWEDVDFSYRVGQQQKLALVANAEVLHLHVHSDSPERAARIGDLEIVDRFYFVRKHANRMSHCMAIWASLGTIGRNLVTTLPGKNRSNIARVQSNMKALLRCARGDIRRADIHSPGR